MPLSFAVPVNANVLDDTVSPGVYFEFDDYIIQIPQDLPSDFSNFVCLYNDNGDLLVIFSSSRISVSLSSGKCYVDTRAYYIYSADVTSLVPNSLIQFNDYSQSGTSGGFYLPNYGVYSGDVVVSGVSFSSVVLFTRSSVGVLSVFSGVGSWLSGAVQNISTMFWSSESGMTVLGYLAVASLAVAVILLIFYLIAGWLKFR